MTQLSPYRSVYLINPECLTSFLMVFLQSSRSRTFHTSVPLCCGPTRCPDHPLSYHQNPSTSRVVISKQVTRSHFHTFALLAAVERLKHSAVHTIYEPISTIRLGRCQKPHSSCCTCTSLSPDQPADVIILSHG